MQIALIDQHGIERVPRRRDESTLQCELGLTRHEASRGRDLYARLAADGHVEHLERCHAGEVRGEARGDEVLDQRRHGQALALGALLGPERELPIAFARTEIGLTHENAPPIRVLEIDGEVWDSQEGLRTVSDEHDFRILDAEAGQVGRVATTCLLEHFGDGSRHVELAPGILD